MYLEASHDHNLELDTDKFAVDPVENSRMLSFAESQQIKPPQPPQRSHPQNNLYENLPKLISPVQHKYNPLRKLENN